MSASFAHKLCSLVMLFTLVIQPRAARGWTR